MTSRAHRGVAVAFAVALAAVPSVLLVTFNPGGTAGTLLVLWGTAFAVLLDRAGVRASRTLLAALVTVLSVASCVRGPLWSGDMWSYAMYGRIVEHYHANPYVVVPASFRHDLMLRHIGWRHTTSAYGPLFVAFAAIVARIGGSSLLVIRLMFQTSTALAVAAIVYAITRQTGDTRAALFFALQPFIWISIVNGAHNDVYIGLAAVVVAGLLRRGAVNAAGVTIALAALVKLTALIMLPVVVIAMFSRHERRSALRLSIVSLTTFLAGTIATPAALSSAYHATRGLVTRASPWDVLVATHLVARARSSKESLIVVIVVTALVALLLRHREYALSVGMALAAFCVFSSYVLPWYAVWGLPVALVTSRRSAAVVITARAALLVAAYQTVRAARTAPALQWFVASAAPWLLVVTFLGATVFVAARRTAAST